MKINNYSSFLEKKSALYVLTSLQERQFKDSLLLNMFSTLKRSRNKKKKSLSLKRNASSTIIQGAELTIRTLGCKWIKNSKLRGMSKLMIGIAALIMAKMIRDKLSTHNSN